MRVRRWPIAGALFGLLWVFVRGAELSADSLLGNFLVGFAVGLPVAYVFRRLYREGIDLRQSAGGIPYVVRYVLVFVREVVVANFDVAYRVLAPWMPLEPQVILVPLRVETDLGVTTIANSITITPGTITLDHDPDGNALYVHVIDGRNLDSIVELIRTWEDYALVVFDEERSPSDPAPDVRVHPPGHPPEPQPDRRRLDRPDAASSREDAGTRGEDDGR